MEWIVGLVEGERSPCVSVGLLDTSGRASADWVCLLSSPAKLSIDGKRISNVLSDVLSLSGAEVRTPVSFKFVFTGDRTLGAKSLPKAGEKVAGALLVSCKFCDGEGADVDAPKASLFELDVFRKGGLYSCPATIALRSWDRFVLWVETALLTGDVAPNESPNPFEGLFACDVDVIPKASKEEDLSAFSASPVTCTFAETVAAGVEGCICG